MKPLHRTVIYLSSDYADYTRSIVEQVRVAANAAGYGLVCVTGRELEAEGGESTERAVCNGVYRLIKRVDAAGILCESGMLGHQAGPAAVIRFLEDCRLPCVSLGLDVPGMPSVVADDVIGMTRLMEHLVADPQRRRFAFVRGVPHDMYSLQREHVFRQTLLRHGRRVDEALLVTGHYDPYRSYSVVASLLREHAGIDVIVAANDAMALSAARAAVAAGLAIPDDIAITGFDDVPDATRLSPALTTVRQPLAEIAELGIVKLLERIGDGPPRHGTASAVPRLSVVASELVVRGSSTDAATRGGELVAFDAPGLGRLLVHGMDGLKAPAGADMGAVVRALAATIADGSAVLADLVRPLAQRVEVADAHWWSNLCHQVEALGTRLPPALVEARLPLIVAALVPVRERGWAVEMEREFKARRLERMRSRMQLQIGSSAGLTDILATIDVWLRAYRPRRFFLVQYDRPGPVPDGSGRLIRALVDGGTRPGAAPALSTATILPDEYRAELEHGSLVMNPIYAGAEHFGYLLIDPHELDLSELDSAAHSIGNALRSRFLFKELERQAARLQQANDELSTLANRDGLTGIANRLCFEARLREACERGARFAVCFIDLDGFKPVNDRLGHETGDELLRQVARRLERVVDVTVGESGFAARLGGDEFTLLLHSDTPEPMLRRVAATVLGALSEPFRAGADTVSISASIGGAIFPDHGADTSTLLRHADGAMYAAKAAGRNGFVLSGRAGPGRQPSRQPSR